MHPAMVLAFVLASAFAWAFYFYVKDRYEPEPRGLLLVVFLVGAASTVPAYLLHRLASVFGFGEELLLSPNPLVRFAFVMLLGGVLEECCKFLSVQVLVGRHPEFDEPLDGLIYAAFGALGFASVESFVLAPWLDGPTLWGRIVASPLTHCVFAMVWGHALSLDRFAHRRHPFRVACGLALACLLHGLYDWLVMGSGMMRLLGAGLILVLWIAFLVEVPRLLSRSPHRPAAAKELGSGDGGDELGPGTGQT